MTSDDTIRNVSDYPAGSEWRRWDLHIHTPETNKEDSYFGSTTEEKWDAFYQNIANYVGDGSDPSKAIAVMGVTDYVTIDNYKKVVADNRLPECVKLIIPNIEMRMTPVAQAPVNIHFLFDPAIVDQLETRFFSQLKIDIGGKPYHPVKSELIALGKTNLPNQTDERVLLKKGVELFVISKDAIDDVMKKDPDLRNHVLIGVSNSTNDGVSGVGRNDFYKIGTGSQMDAVISSIFKMADFVFSGNPNDVEYFLGRKKGANCSREDVIDRCGSLMPCVIGSDAHKNEDVFEPALKRYCWIKADPTFNGLRQIVYEPGTRVKIQEMQPEQKERYYVIDGVSFGEVDIDKRIEGTDLQGMFSGEYIPFNDHLNCIIGGKSTGKSLLLHNIAYAIDPTQVKKKCENKKASAKDSIIDGVCVRWKDGTLSKASDVQHDHKIVYIPQTYLNRLSESQDESTDIDSIIESIVLGKKDNKDAFSKMKSDLDSLKKKTDADIYQLRTLQGEVEELVEQQKEIGTREGIKKEIEDKEKRRKEISEALSISDEDIKKYSVAEHEAAELEGVIRRLTREKESVESIETLVQMIDFSSLDLSDEIQQLLESASASAVQSADKSWQESKIELLSAIIKQISEKQDKLRADNVIIESLGQQVKQNAELLELSKTLKKQKEKLSDFTEIAQKIQDRKNQIAIILDQLAQTFDRYKAIHDEFADYINDSDKEANTDNPAGDDEDLRFIVRSPFRKESFEETLRAKFNKTVLKGQRDIIDLDCFDEKDFPPEKIKMLIERVTDGTLKLLTSASQEETLRSVLSDWYNTTYNVEMDGDTIGAMSPGKKALVLLKMLIKLEDSKCPILIDQPEDDLDNRSIFRELTPFILSRKVDRQIIVVTHNANVVLGSDAEEVIVANQDGKNTPNKSYKFEYVTGAIEHCGRTCGGKGVLYQFSIQQHICDILEGGREAFKHREQKYRISKED